jgi:peptide/nickel transport system substrate-binding protein
VITNNKLDTRQVCFRAIQLVSSRRKKEMFSNKIWCIVTLLVIVGMITAACGPTPTTAPPAPTEPPTTAPPAPTEPPTTAPTEPAAAVEPLKVVLVSEAFSMDPTVDINKPALVIINTMIEPLVMNTPEGTYIPWLAESWEAIEPTRWRIYLKQGVKFHNGEPFNADAVTYSVDAFLEAKQVRSYFSFITGTEKVDDYTVDILTDQVVSILPASLAYLYVFPPEYRAEMGDDFGLNPIGTGPWRFVEWTKGVDLKVELNPDYWGPKPSIDQIVFRWAPEASTRVAMLETGEADIVQNVPPAFVERVNASGTARIETAKSIRKVFLRINVQEGPTADVRVRKALNHAVNVESIIENLFLGRAYGRDTGAMILEGMVGYEEGRLEPYKYDPELAKELLAEAGYPDGFSTKLWHTLNRYMYDKEAAAAIADQLAQVGIDAELIGMEAGAFFSTVDNEQVEGMNMTTCGALFMTPLYCARFHWYPGTIRAYGANERTEEYLDRAMAAVDVEEQAKILQEFEDYIYYEHVPIVWLWHQQDIYGVSNRLDWKARRDELLSFETASFK